MYICIVGIIYDTEIDKRIRKGEKEKNRTKNT